MAGCSPTSGQRGGRRQGTGGSLPSLSLVALLAVLLSLFLATAAGAAPPQPIMGLADLRAALESGPLDGCFLTTMEGSTPERLAATVDGVVDYSWGSLILFHSDDPAVSAIGGIAAGMSGSPLYVNDGGSDRLVGAVSYGDWFTLHGLALATPIEYMAAVEDTYGPPVGLLAPPPPPQPGTYRLAAPVDTAAGSVRRVVIAASVSAAERLEPAAGDAVMVPLGIVEIGGLRPDSDAFRRLAAKLAGSGMLVKAGSGAGLWQGPPAPDLEPGSPCAVLFSLGSVWVGAAGTVTYVDGDSAMLFGHPFEWLGTIDAALTGGNVDGLWASAIEPYKLISPRDVKGTVVQDRYWGLLADLGREPDLFPLAVTVDVAESGRHVEDLTYVAQWLMTQPDYASLPADIAWNVLTDAADQSPLSGSAESATTVRVSDGSGEYVVSRENLHDSAWDVTWGPADDLYAILATLTADPDGVIDARVDGVDMQVTLSGVRRSARLADVTLPAGLYWGDNPLVVSYYRYGSRDLETVEGTLTVPPGTPLQGRLTVVPGAWGGGDCCCCCGEEGDGPPATLADLVDGLNTLPKDSDLLVSFSAEGGDGECCEGDCGQQEPTVSLTLPTGWVFRNSFSRQTAELRLWLRPRKVPYRGTTLAAGWVRSQDDVEVSVYRHDAGSDALLPVGQTVARADATDGYAWFELPVEDVTRNTTIVAMTGATATRLPGTATRPLTVSAWVRLGGTRQLTVRVRPGDADGTARLLRRVGDRWQRLRTVTVTDGVGTTTLKPGTYVLRARFLGSDVCGPGTSPVYRVTVR